jgi:hypothetical protein
MLVVGTLVDSNAVDAAVGACGLVGVGGAWCAGVAAQHSEFTAGADACCGGGGGGGGGGGSSCGGGGGGCGLQ